MTTERVVVERRGAVAHVRLNRPDKRNALDLAMFEALVAAGTAVGADGSVRAVVLSGEGPAFCAGLDWAAFLASGTEGPARLLARDPATSPANLAQRAAWIWREIPQPVVAAIRGACLGGGLQLALAADLRFCGRDATLGLREIRYGIVPDMGMTRTLQHLVRPDLARELVYTGRDVAADEALAIGLVTHLVDDPVASALALATTIAERSPDATRAAKRLWDDALDLDVAGALARETELQVPLLGSPNQLEAVAAVLEKRPPTFRDPS